MNGDTNRFKALVLGVLTAVPLLALGCGKRPDQSADVWPDKPGPKVVVSFAPLYCFAASVAGEDATVKNVMTSKGPHDFDPTADDVKLITKADLFFTIGMGLDDKSAEAMQKGSGNTNLKLIKLGKRIPEGDLCEGFCNHADHAGHDHGIDPHVWLGPDHAVILVNAIRDELKAADPAHAAGYEARAAEYVKKLQALKAYGLEQFKEREERRLVTFHDSMSYFAKCFKLKISGVLTKTPGQEPNDKEMAELIKVCTSATRPVRVIVTEPQYSTSNSGATLKKELVRKGVANPALVEFDTLETVRPDELTPDWYERKMRQNLDALAKAMQ